MTRRPPYPGRVLSMRTAPALRRVLELAVPLLLAVTVLAFLLSSSWSVSAQRLGSQGRWAALFVLAVLAAVWAWLERRPGIPLLYVPAGLFLLAALVSAAWSVEPQLSVGRAISLAVLFAAAALMSRGAGGRAAAAGRLLDAILGATVVAALAGFAAYVVAPQSASVGSGLSAFRLQGIGQNPNTVSMLAAVGIPIAAAGLFRGTPLRRLAALGAFGLLGLTILLSRSDGAAIGAVAGVVAVGLLLRPGWLRRLTAVAVALGVVGIVVLYFALPPASVQEQLNADYPYVDYSTVQPDSEIGRPDLGGSQPTRSVLNTSGRAEAWREAIGQAEKRPVLGYGFGTEEKVFIDRSYVFQSGRPENSYIGLFMQLGLVGVVLLLAIAGALALAARRALREPDPELHAVAVVATAGVVVGFVLAVYQSYVYSVGNVASAAFWTCAFLLASLGPAARIPRLGRLGAAAVAVGVAAFGLALWGGGSWERSHAVATQQAGILGIRDEVGALAGRRLTGYRVSPQVLPLSCFLYRSGPAPSAYELCWSADGALLEAADRTHGVQRPRIWSLRWAPGDAPLQMPAGEVARLAGHVTAVRQDVAERTASMLAVASRVGLFDSISLTGHRQAHGLDCFVYRFSFYVLCWDGHGRLVESSERTSGILQRWSVADFPWGEPLRATREQRAKWARSIPARRREVVSIRRGLLRVLRAVGPLRGAHLTDVVKADPKIQTTVWKYCYSYRAGGVAAGYTLCFSEDGKLVRAVDATRGPSHVSAYDLQVLPERSPAHVAPALVERIAHDFRTRRRGAGG